MTSLERLIADHLRDLSGAECKLAVYLYQRLARRREVRSTITELAQATGVSWRQTQSALRSLDKKRILQVESFRRGGTRCSLPPRPKATPAHAKPTTADPLPETEAKPDAPVAAPPATPPPPDSTTAETIPPPEIKPVGDTAYAGRLAYRLMDTVGKMPVEQVNLLLSAADYDYERLERRLERLTAENRRKLRVRTFRKPRPAHRTPEALTQSVEPLPQRTETTATVGAGCLNRGAEGERPS